MPYETGGRADKFGNRYESHWVVNQLIRLLNEEIESVTIEAIGEEEDGVDLWIRKIDGSKECHQCKARNSSNEIWNLGDLAARGIFKHVKKQLEFKEDVSYNLVSAVSGLMINDLTNRARNSNDNAEDFYNYQIKSSGKDVIRAYNKLANYLELDINTVNGRLLIHNYLKRMYFIHYPDDIYTKTFLLEKIKFLYSGNTDIIYNLIMNYAIENDNLGRQITAYKLNSYLLNYPTISQRQLSNNTRIIPRLDVLNNEFISSFVPINNSIIHRAKTDICYSQIIEGNSSIVHGRAGNGKSGCIIELLEKLKDKNVVHLALKLDRRHPEHTSEKFGQNMGLPASPILCLDAISKTDEAVLILDQLDAIRWTSVHSKTALEVCKEMIREAHYINKNRDKKIVIVLVCRTFDFENDIGVKSLITSNVEKDEQLSWKSISIDELEEVEVKAVVGNEYDFFSKKMKEIIRNPNNLFIWTNLDEKRRNGIFISSSELIKQWWNQICYECEKIELTSYDIFRVRDTIVQYIDKTSNLLIPSLLLNDCSRLAIQKLLSNGLLVDSEGNIGFVHQSFYDYFSVERMANQIYEGVQIVDVIGSKVKQTPQRRYQLQMLLEQISEYDINLFIDIGRRLLEGPEIRFYMKYVFLEVLGQVEVLTHKLKIFIEELLINDYWRVHLIEAVVIRHQVYVVFLIDKGYILKWLSSKEYQNIAYEILTSVNNEIPDKIVSVLYTFAFNNFEIDNKIYNCLNWKIIDDSDRMFDFRLELLSKETQLRNIYIDWSDILEKKPIWAIKLLDIFVKNNENLDIHNSHSIDQNEIDKFLLVASNYFKLIWDTYLPYLAKATLNIKDKYSKDMRFWDSREFKKYEYGRIYINMIKSAAKELIKGDSEEILNIIQSYYYNDSIVINEVLLYIMEELPVKYSDFVISWLLEKQNMRLFNYTGENDEYLYSSKMIIEKHSKTCSNETFNMLEDTIYYYHDKDELNTAKWRFEYNYNNRMVGSKELGYLCYWGKVQHYLISSLDSNRVSKKIIELEMVLKRRFDFENNYIPYRRLRSFGGSVGSTIGSNADKISDKQWLRIIENKKLYKNRHERWPKLDGKIIESSPEQFSNDLERIGKKNPNRFAKLAMKFSERVDNHYLYAIYHLIGEDEINRESKNIENLDPVGSDLAEKLFIKFSDRNHTELAVYFCRAVSNRASLNWSNEILNMLSNIIKYHDDPMEGQMNVLSSKDKLKTVDMLHTNSINCARGCAAGAIAELLWKDKKRYEVLKDAVEAVVLDEHLAVNMAAIECILPFMNIDRENATKYFFKLATKDIRIAAHPYAYNLFYYLFESNPEEIKYLVLQMYESKYEDVSETGARHISNMYLLYDCFKTNIFNTIKKTKVQKKGIIEIAINLLKNREFHDKSKGIIELFLDDEDDFNNYYSQILYRGSVSIENDLDFIVKVVNSKIDKLNLQNFVNFINELDPPIEAFRDIILGMCHRFAINKPENNNINHGSFGMASELSRLIAMLYDRTQDDFEEINQQCLDMWDLMFEKRIGAARELSQSIMNC